MVEENKQGPMPEQRFSFAPESGQPEMWIDFVEWQFLKNARAKAAYRLEEFYRSKFAQTKTETNE